MIKHSEIIAQSGSALKEAQILALDSLVRSYPNYSNNVALYPDIDVLLLAEQTTPTVKTKKLKAILARLEALPTVVVDSFGNDKASSTFSARQNWYELAQDVLNTFYRPMTAGQRSFVLVQRTVQDLILNDDSVLRAEDTGRRY